MVAPSEISGHRHSGSASPKRRVAGIPIAPPPPGIARLIFPRGVRIWHFVLIPAMGMAAFLAISRVVGPAVAPYLGAPGLEIFETARMGLIGLLMASLIGVLAVWYRTGYEEKLAARNDELETTQDFLSRIIEGSADAIVTRDAVGRVTSWNPAAEAIFGRSAEEMVGRPVEPLLPPAPATHEEFRWIDARLRSGETIRDFETTRLRRDGKPITVALTMAPLYDAQGDFAGSSAIVRDVTALKEMERQLLERERLAAVGELAAMMAHEVRNPLAGIRGGCEILLEGCPEDDPRTEIGAEVLHQVDRLNRTVQDLLLFARPKAMDRVPTEIRTLVDRILYVLREDPAHADVEIVRDIDPELPPVQVDARQIEQVLLNLVLNASQAMEHRGVVTLRARASTEGLEITVSDDGPGIPRDKLDQIFKPFFTTRAQGTGLGLAIVKKIVEAHGGRIEASPAPEGGASFHITLPMEP